tara:strand:+ start:722 stop:1393 length:672 start_codon:yes stop_codon:yes gene_type:complete
MILKNYVWQAPEYFTRQEIQELITASDVLPWHAGQVGTPADEDSEQEGGTEDHNIRSSQIKWFLLEQNHMPKHIENKLYQAIDIANEQCEWNHAWDYMENPQYTVYNEQKQRQGDFYTWHTDSGPFLYPNGCHRKLSMTVQLSDQDDYEGGHFQWLEPHQQFDKMFTNVSNIDMTDAVKTLSFSAKSIGSVVVFPSFLYHQVTPVLRGTRKSLVCWFSGKPYV